jgi:hypothetical protein
MSKAITVLFSALFMTIAVQAESLSVKPVDPIHEFGHIGIDFVVFHTYKLVNNEPEPVEVSEVNSKCECTRIRDYDSIIPPGDSGYFRVEFSTRDYYGPVQRGFEVVVGSSSDTTFDFNHRAVVGQWFFGLKPDPISVFMLPSHESRRVIVPNTEHDRIRLSLVEQADTTFDVRIVEDEADRGEQVELQVIPSAGLDGGTYLSSFTVAVAVEGGTKPALLTIPVKIVRY